MRGLPVAALACSSACAQLFGIDNTTGAAPPGTATFTLTRQSIGAGVTPAPQDLSTLMATFYPDPTMPIGGIMGTQAAPGQWSATVGNATPAVVYTQPDLPMMYPHMWVLPSRAVKAHFNVLEHPNPQPPPMAASERIELSLPTPYDGVQTFDVYIVGAWMHHQLTSTEVPQSTNLSQISTAVPYSTFTSLTPSPGARFTAADAVLVLRRSGNLLTGVYQAPGADQTDTGETIGGTGVQLQPVAASKTLATPISPSTFNTRFQTVRPGLTPTTLAMNWAITAAPGYNVGAISGPLLQAGAAGMGDMMVSTTYGNPFESQGWHAVLQFVANESRTFVFGQATLTFSAQIQTLIEPATASTLDLPAPLPEQISIDAHQLNSDGSNVALDVTQPHTVSMLVESSPAATIYFVWINEITVNGTNSTRTMVFDARSTDPSITLPANVFKTGSNYTITAGAIAGGFTNAANGDVDTVTLPYSFSQADSGLFTVVAP